MAKVMVWDPLERLIQGFAISIFILGFILYFTKGIKKENAKERLIMFGYAGLMLGLSITTLLIYIWRLYVPGTYFNSIYYGDFSKVGSTFKLYVRISYFFFHIGFVIFILTYEINFKRTKYVLSILYTSLCLLILIIPYDWIMVGGYSYLMIINSLAYLYGTFVFLYILLIYTRWSSLEFKAISSYIFLGTVFLGYGAAFTTLEVLTLNLLPVWLSPLLLCLGGLLYISPLLVTSKDFTRTFRYWSFLGYITIAVQVFFFFFYIYFGFPVIYTAIVLFLLIFFIYFQFTVLKNIRTSLSINGKEKSPSKILGTIARPKRLTEEEVSISKEKKICLVCKGKVEGFNFICSSCGAFYCEKCTHALINLENACWVCEFPFDKSKPVKLQKIEKEGIKIPDDNKKKFIT